ncbi:hypothetical protein BJ138DRAFT_1115166 [Hygrophoropsis aurantiaca]|uniref:Uncharacterized protein n=1 Tax=Hygrophoropsis aurantiaca TaxID=72124 RepID=A0ACB8A927_9AGAM|nr:hypothetical protein BJ138DRAFT_1115166 [Hygrophoropsis aurantiaca]
MRFTLSSEYVCNTILTNEEGQVVYKTKTSAKLSSLVPWTTIISKITPNIDENDMRDKFAIMAAIEWHSLSSSIFRFGGEEHRAKDFLPNSGILRLARTFTGPDGRSYKWKMENTAAVLYLDDGSKPKTEVAKYHKRGFGIIGKKHDPYLDVFSEGKGILDTLILTFIYVEKLQMDGEYRLDTVSIGSSGSL